MAESQSVTITQAETVVAAIETSYAVTLKIDTVVEVNLGL